MRNAFGKLEKKGLVRLYRWHGKPFRWPGRGGGPFSLYLLTGDGRCWYEQVHGAEPVESEIERVVQDHQSPKHGVAILEAHDLLAQRAGYAVDAAPAPILLTDDPWGERVEPDLAVEVQGETWPVEVQVEVSRRQTAKWDKVLRCTERLMLVVLTEQSQANQRQKLYEARQTRRLSPGTLRLANLEAMGTPGWQWEDFVLS